MAHPSPADPPARERTFQLLRALRLVWIGGPRWVVAHGLLVLVLGMLPLLVLALSKLLVDAVAGSVGAADPAAAIDRILALVLLSGGAALLISVCRSLHTLVNRHHGERVSDAVHERILTRSIELDLAYYENPDYHDTLHRAQQEGPHRPYQVLMNLSRLGEGFVTLVAVSGLLLSLAWWISAVVVVAAVPPVLVRFHFSKQREAWNRERTQDARQAFYYGSVLTSAHQATGVRMFQVGRWFKGRWSAIRGRLRNESLGLLVRQTRAGAAVEVLAAGATWGSYFWLAVQVVGGALTIGDLVMYAAAVQRGQGAVAGMLGSVAGLYDNGLYLRHYFEFMDLSRQVPEPATPRSVPASLTRGIRVEGVGFRYPSRNEPVFSGLDLEARPGELLALVGENGAGKTTLIKLLCRLYDPSHGRITVDGTDIKEFATQAWRRAIAAMLQDYVRYDLTARDNIGLGDLDRLRRGGDEDVWRAAEMAGIAQMLRGLPDGLDTMLGRSFAGGRELSVGEWQKLALARLFYRDAAVVILDEPTSALDARTEMDLVTRFREHTKDRLGLLVSHRLTTVRHADRICVLDDGRIVEDGTHEKLMALRGPYFRLFPTGPGAE